MEDLKGFIRSHEFHKEVQDLSLHNDVNTHCEVEIKALRDANLQQCCRDHGLSWWENRSGMESLVRQESKVAVPCIKKHGWSSLDLVSCSGFVWVTWRYNGEGWLVCNARLRHEERESHRPSAFNSQDQHNTSAQYHTSRWLLLAKTDKSSALHYKSITHPHCYISLKHDHVHYPVYV